MTQVVTDEAFPGEGVMRCTACGGEMPVGTPYATVPNGMVDGTPMSDVVCIPCSETCADCGVRGGHTWACVKARMNSSVGATEDHDATPQKADTTCRNCGHDSPHVQQDGDECSCGCVDYDCPKYPARPVDSDAP